MNFNCGILIFMILHFCDVWCWNEIMKVTIFKCQKLAFNMYNTDVKL